MSVRRLAKEQPASFAFTKATLEEKIQNILQKQHA